MNYLSLHKRDIINNYIPLLPSMNKIPHMRLLTIIMIILSSLETFGQPDPIPQGQIIKFKANKAEEEIVITYTIDIELIKNHLITNEIKPYIIKKPNYSRFKFLDSSKTYVYAALAILYCSDCYYDNNKFKYSMKNWVWTNNENLNLNPKAIGEYTAIEIGTWLENINILKQARSNGLNFQKATFDRLETQNKVEYSILSEDFKLSMSFKKDTVSNAMDIGNKGPYQTVWDSDGQHFTVYSSYGSRERKIKDFMLKIETSDLIIKSANNHIFAEIQEDWTAIGGTYKN